VPVVHEDAETVAVLDASPAVQAAAMARWGLPPATIALLVNSCEQRCFFCANPGTTSVPASATTPWQRLHARLLARPEPVRTLLIGGNEPLLHPDYDRLLVAAREAGFGRIEVMTSGLRRVRGVEAVAVPLYAADAGTHDAIVGSAAWDRVVAGLDAAAADGIAVRVHTIAMRRTLPGLPALARMVRERWGTKLSVAPLREKADVFRYDDEAVPLEELQLDGEITLVGFPDCVAPHLERGAAAIIEVYFRCQKREHAPICAGCSARERCPGVVAAELARRGSKGLAAL
jgi:hypothetical protein